MKQHLSSNGIITSLFDHWAKDTFLNDSAAVLDGEEHPWRSQLFGTIRNMSRLGKLSLTFPYKHVVEGTPGSSTQGWHRSDSSSSSTCANISRGRLASSNSTFLKGTFPSLCSGLQRHGCPS